MCDQFGPGQESTEHLTLTQDLIYSRLESLECSENTEANVSISQYSLSEEWWIQHQTWKWTGDAKLPTSVWTTVRGVGNSISVLEGSTWKSFLFSIILTIIFFSSAKSSYSHPYLPLIQQQHHPLLRIKPVLNVNIQPMLFRLRQQYQTTSTKLKPAQTSLSNPKQTQSNSDNLTQTQSCTHTRPVNTNQ